MKSGTEVFRSVSFKKGKSFLEKGTSVLVGQKFPLAETVIGKDVNKIKDREEVTVYFYARK